MKMAIFCFSVLAVALTAVGEPVGRVVLLEAPVKVWTNQTGRIVADFGTDRFGNLEVTGDGEVWIGEKLTADGVIDRAPPGSVRAYKLPLAADKRNTGSKAVPIPAEFGIVAPFRYAEYDTGRGIDVRRRTLVVPMDMGASSFACSDKRLEAVWAFCKETILATSFAGIYVDGDRERIPYEADAYINMLGEQTVWANGAMAKATIEWLAKNPTWPTEWAQMFVTMVHDYWLWTGDKETLEHFAPLCRERMKVGKARKDGLLIRKSKNIVDWPQCERDGYDMAVGVNAVVNALYIRNLREMGDAAEAERVKAAFAKVFIDPESGLVLDGEKSRHSSLHANALAISLGLVPEENRAKVWRFCKSRGMACSAYFAQFLLEAAFEMDDADYALGLMTSDGERSWLGMMRNGATMCMESWSQEVKPNQDWNHAWNTAPLNVVFRKLLGVESLEPGCAKIRIRPRIGTLEFAEGRIPTPRGTVAVSCRTDSLTVEIPDGVAAEVVLPWNGEIKTIKSGRHEYLKGE